MQLGRTHTPLKGICDRYRAGYYKVAGNLLTVGKEAFVNLKPPMSKGACSNNLPITLLLSFTKLFRVMSCAIAICS